MPRKPITELAGGKSPRQRVWETIRAWAGTGSGTFTATDLARASKIEIEPVREYLKCLVAGGWVGIVMQGRIGVKSVYRLEKDNGIEAPRVRRDGSEVIQGSGNEAMWGAISVLGEYDAQTIADLSGARLSTAKFYCMFLERAGYLQVIRAGKGKGNGGTPTLWRTVKSRISGPRAPMITSLKAVYDPNLHQVMWAEGADEAAEGMDHA